MSKLLRFLIAVFSIVLILPVHNVSAANPTERDYIFLIDLSGSMRGDNLVAAKSAITEILGSGNIKGRISIIGFGTNVATILEPSYNIKEAIKVLSGLKTSGNTALYDGLSVALEKTKKSANTSIITITDGEDTSSKLSLSDVLARFSIFDGEIHFISLTNDLKVINNLNLIAGKNGSVSRVVDLENLFQALAPLITKQDLKLKMDQGSKNVSPGLFLGFFISLAVSLLFIILFAFYAFGERSNKLSRMKLLKAYDDEENQNKTREKSSIFLTSLRFKLFYNYVKNEEKKLLGAGLNFSAQNWIYSKLAVLILLFITLTSYGLPILVSFLMAYFVGFGMSYSYLKNVRAKKAKLFSDELPDSLAVIAGSLKSGLSFSQAVESVAKQGDNEIALQFRRVLAEVQLGRPLNDALFDVAERMNSTDFRWTISALAIQREVGGNLSEILTSTAATIRGRAEIRREVRTLSAEGRMSAYILVAMPFFMMLYLRLTKPEYITILFAERVGNLMLGVVAFLMIIGWIWVKKVIEVKLT